MIHRRYEMIKEMLTGNETLTLKSKLTDILENDGDFGGKFYLDGFEFNEATNTVMIRVGMPHPLPGTTEEIKAWAEAYVWRLVKETPATDKAFHVRNTLITIVGKNNKYILWGHSSYDHESQSYAFSEESGMQLYD